MFGLDRLHFLGTIGLKFCRFGLFGENLLNSSTQTIKSIGKWYHSCGPNFSHEWNEQQQEKVNYIRNELTLYSLQSLRVPKPEWVSKSEYLEMLAMTTSRRRDYYNYLHSKYWSTENRKTKKIIRDALLKEKEECEGLWIEKLSRPGHIQYGLGKNSLMLRISNQHIARWKNRNLVRAYFQNEPPLIFDCEFVKTMNRTETESAVREITLSFSALRENKTPFVMHLCNLEEGSYFWDRLKNGFKGFQTLPIIVSSKDVTELYPSATENLIYLTPDAERVLDKVEPNYGYIIGAIVDKGDKKPYTLAKGKKLNIQTARLPIDGCLKFHAQRALPFDQVTKVLLEAKRSNDWKKAFTHIARRKLM